MLLSICHSSSFYPIYYVHLFFYIFLFFAWFFVLPCSQNILLDAEYRAKIADFSVINLLPQKVGSTYFISVGGIHALSSSRGYLPPEYGDGYEGVETDVYSFGIVRIRIIIIIIILYYCT